MDEFPSIKKVKTIDLIPYARNSRTHSDEQINQIAASIKEFGFLNPVIIDSENGIIAGHGRVMAANKLNIKELPCVDASHLSETQRRAYVIADNKLGESGGWDEDMLRIEFEFLGENNFDIEITGFYIDDVSKIFDETKGIKIEDSLSDELLDTFTIKFDPKVKTDLMNALCEMLQSFNGAQLWCGDEQI